MLGSTLVGYVNGVSGPFWFAAGSCFWKPIPLEQVTDLDSSRTQVAVP